jgi:GNAT superfamily N-acetyltransferase
VTLKIRRLTPDDDRSGFRSGNIELDRFFQRYAGQNQFRHHIGTTYIAVDPSETILGFATVTASEIRAERLPAALRKKLPRYPLPVVRLARLAVDARARGKGVGSLLLRGVLALARDLAVSVGCVGVLVDAKTEAVEFYERIGFLRLDSLAGQLADRPEPVQLFLELGQLSEPE